MKDNFSAHADQYVRYRPEYPHALYDHLLALVKDRQAAWDCGTGNGQMAQVLAQHFAKVEATDISRQQIDHAAQHPRIHYSVSPAEHTPFPDTSFDLITVAQAIHWFDFNAFYGEVRRTIKKDGILAVIGYGLIETVPAVDVVIQKLYREIVGPFWDKERRYIDEGYKTIPFPFSELETPAFDNSFEWSFHHLIGYLRTWSAVKHYERKKGSDPLALVYDELRTAVGETDVVKGKFPILARTARI